MSASVEGVVLGAQFSCTRMPKRHQTTTVYLKKPDFEGICLSSSSSALDRNLRLASRVVLEHHSPIIEPFPNIFSVSYSKFRESKQRDDVQQNLCNVKCCFSSVEIRSSRNISCWNCCFPA